MQLTPFAASTHLHVSNKMPPQNHSLSQNLATTVAEAGCIGLSTEILEFTIDQTLTEGLLKDLPIVGWIAKGVSIGSSISDRIFYNKILRFLLSLERHSESSKDTVRKKIKENRNYGRKVGEQLLMILNKIDDFDKADMMAVCFDHFLSGDIEHQHFVELAQIIERSPIRDLKELQKPPNEVIRFTSKGIAVASGILEFGIADSEDQDGKYQIGTRYSQFGRDLKDILRNEFRGRDERIKIEFEKRNREINKALSKLRNEK